MTFQYPYQDLLQMLVFGFHINESYGIKVQVDFLKSRVDNTI